MQCASGEQCFYGQCFPIGSFGLAEFGFGFFAQQDRRAVAAGTAGGGLNSTFALEGNLTAGGGLVPLPPSQLTDGLPAWGELRKNGSGLSGGWWRRRRRRGGKTNSSSSSSGLVGASSGGGGGSSPVPPNYDDDSEFYDDLAAIVEPYRAYMDLRPVEMRPELLSAAPSSVARGGGGGGGLVGASAGDGASPHGDVALFPSYNPKTVAALPSSLGAGSSLLGGAPGEFSSFRVISSFIFRLFFSFLFSEVWKEKKLTLPLFLQFTPRKTTTTRHRKHQAPSSTPSPRPATRPT